MQQYLTLKQSNCKNCYKCIRNCPVKSIKFADNQAYIIEDECILCGHCFVGCPQDAKQIVGSTDKVKSYLADGQTVIASVAPSFIANYDGAGITSIEKALKQLGFAAVEETALGATAVKTAYERLLSENKQDIVLSSCCSSVNLLVQKHFPHMVKYLADVMSPMQAHCKSIKERYPGAKAVFIGPCVSKKDEAERYPGIVDAAITYQGLTRWLQEAGIEIERNCDSTDESLARFFPTTGGILKTMVNKPDNYVYMAVDGIDNCISVLHEIENGSLDKCFVEMSSCLGSCINGPVMEKTAHKTLQSFSIVTRYAGRKDFDVKPSGLDELDISSERGPLKTNAIIPGNIEINAILKLMGKTKPDDELNCGTCGYDTCRDKAVAVYQKKADLTMCLPFLKEKAESFSDHIISNTPNGIIVVDEDLVVQQINNAAKQIINLPRSSNIIGDKLVRILDPKDFLHVLQTGRGIREKTVYLPEYNKYVSVNIVYDKNYRILICIMRDITNIEFIKEEKESIKRNAVAIADKVIEKQMTVVQEIASLLGETAAETKIALTKLKDSLNDD